jgi:hypothetical protein
MNAIHLLADAASQENEGVASASCIAPPHGGARQLVRVPQEQLGLHSHECSQEWSHREVVRVRARSYRVCAPTSEPSSTETAGRRRASMPSSTSSGRSPATRA